ncbi:helix-turn-helix transcriptional regulator [Arthrobacter sp. FX8]|uniref:helix-turn-helix domain-containing protein n=1 Tax=Arthrobacter sp. FX8 TaxID=2997335 RepID=UPI00227C1D83|nr:helix-turn-helix transcriptional regulator [Arthrobacter sp. FX8]WAJ32488.1 helix-turn-helix transcriptional regulator [Arthrobacter sp. FX8]
MTEQARDRAEDQHAGDGSAEVAGRLEQVIAAQVRHYRTAAGLSSAELAARTGLSKAMISRVETATTSCSLTTLQRLADGLKVPVTALFRGADTDRDATFTKSGQEASPSAAEPSMATNTVSWAR